MCIRDRITTGERLMSEFFKSEQVRNDIFELENLQRDLALTMSSGRPLNSEQRKEHVDKLKLFLEKQKVFFFRISLSDDPEAIQIKENIMEAAKMFGFDEMTGMDEFFEQLDKTIKKVEEGLDI